MSQHDLVIRGGTLVDGTGDAPREADLAIDGDHISAIGTEIEQGRREIDARGRLVTPGLGRYPCPL
jgi:N-acyl-D-aspartate/D-glutamate deacylase